MKLESLRIQNLRAIDDETIYFDDYTCLVGANGCGKSTILCALNIFFRETTESRLDLINLDIEDFHNGDITRPIIITATFADLSEEAKEDFADYYRQEKLIITAIAEFDPESGAAIVNQHGERTGMEQFRKFFEAEDEGKNVPELREIYKELRKEFTDLPETNTKQSMIDALHSYEENNPDLCGLILSGDQFYGFSRGANRLAKYIQWIFVPAVKDATNEQTEAKDTALGKLLTRTVRARINFQEPLKVLREETKTKYQDLISQYQTELKEISDSLQNRIIEWAHPDVNIKLEWQQDPDKTVRLDDPFAQIIVGEGPFSGNLARLGHGLQRSYLLALLQELSMSNPDISPTLLLGCEEPELYQHPPQVKHLANVLQKLSNQNSQIIVTTHSPQFVYGRGFENVRLVRKDITNSTAKVNQIKFADIDQHISTARGEQLSHPAGVLAKIHQALQPSLNEMFFTNHLVLVEGLEDLAYLTTYFNLMGLYDDFRKHGIHIVPTNNKTNMIFPLCIAKKLSMPTFIVFDSDGHMPDKNGSRERHRKDNSTLLTLSGIAAPDPFPADNYWGDNVVMWKSDIGDVIKSDFNTTYWDTCCNAIRNKYANVGGLNKNSLFIADTLEAAWNDGNKSTNLEKLCTAILNFATN